MMTNATVFLAVIFVLSGCATVTYCPQDNSSSAKIYAPADENSKTELLSDLRAGKLIIGAALDHIRETYGDADNMLVAKCTVRIIYRLDSRGNVTLWFEDGMHLTMWSD